MIRQIVPQSAMKAAFPEVAEFAKSQPYHMAIWLMDALWNDPETFSRLLELVRDYHSIMAEARENDRITLRGYLLYTQTAGHA